MLLDVAIRLAARIGAVDPDGATFLRRIDREMISASLHDIGDTIARAEVDWLASLVQDISRARPNELANFEKRLRAHLHPGASVDHKKQAFELVIGEMTKVDREGHRE
jgi:hypothetical protein